LGFGQYAGEVATADVSDELKEQARIDAEKALATPLEAFNSWFLAGQPFVGGEQPSIADMRWAATLEFLRAIDYEFPAWAEEYLERMEGALGEAYSEPVADVRGYIDYVKSQAVTA
jgi:glutathione S-transferase